MQIDELTFSAFSFAAYEPETYKTLDEASSDHHRVTRVTCSDPGPAEHPTITLGRDSGSISLARCL